MKSINDTFAFTLPTRIIFGLEMAKTIGEKASQLGRRALIVTDKFLSTTSVMKTILISLKENSIETTIMDDVIPNPLDLGVYKGVSLYQENKCDLIIAVGGGSSIDSAKGIGAIITNGGKIQDLVKLGSIKKPLPPFITVPTTAGTGSEATVDAVISDSETHEKLILSSLYLLPTISILDPTLTISLPRHQTAFTGVDALSHAIEAYTARTSTPFSEAMGCYAIGLVGKYLQRAYRDGTDIEARGGMLLASHMGGIAISNGDKGCILGSIHTMGEVLAKSCDLSHGAAMAIFLPYIMEQNLKATTDKYAHVASLLGLDVAGLTKLEAAEKGIEYIKEMERECKIPPLSSYEVDPTVFDELSEICKQNFFDPMNPEVIDTATYKELYLKAYNNYYGI